VVEAELDCRPYLGEQPEDIKRFRVVGVLVADTDNADYELYITNLSCEEFLPDELVTIYSRRWETELLFNELKTQYVSTSSTRTRTTSSKFCCMRRCW